MEFIDTLNNCSFLIKNSATVC